MDADIFVSGKKKLRIQKYPDTCGRGLRKVANALKLVRCVTMAISRLLGPQYINISLDNRKSSRNGHALTEIARV